MSTPQTEAFEHRSASPTHTSPTPADAPKHHALNDDALLPKIGLWEQVPEAKEVRTARSRSADAAHAPVSNRPKREKIGYSSERNRAFEIMTQPTMLIPVLVLGILMIVYLWLSTDGKAPASQPDDTIKKPAATMIHVPEEVYPEPVEQIAPRAPTVALTPEERQELLRHLQGE